MESALSATPLSFPKTLNLHLTNPKCLLFTPAASLSYLSPLRICSSSIPKRFPRRLECLGSSDGGGAFGGDDGSSGGSGGGGGGEGTGGGDSEAKLGASAADDLSSLSSDVIILNVGGMTCGGCASSVKKILESQPQVSAASVDLASETAIVWPVSEAKALPKLAKGVGRGTS
ncbi:copper-transporting ATPase PAA1, chloroplastic-like [Hibiscus syriacus]|uniref:copper-transporting ATPase PAA1, chloroplastic-like n=1 Tax=Hibiscus syriacus TaxID=106335 RepID=UPI0019229DDF|nr:copper-transporting ATPase PAA1, chloroplastic-like [Hibiscus syriacus]XP_039063914.1 copper-transporting ATPase PAA1, chloroplastic-like [Hibiscus syriacus]